MFSAAGKSAVTSGYNINNSLRLRSSASAWLNRTFSSTGNRKIWTFSAWVKRGQLGTAQMIFNGYSGSETELTNLQFNSTDTIEYYYDNNVTNYRFTTSQVFRDPSAWYHIVLAVDTTQATNTNRAKLYVNGSQVTAFSLYETFPQNSDTFVNGAWGHGIGKYIYPGQTRYVDGYLAEVNFVNAQQLTPSSFGETDGTTGVWKPKKYVGSYGTNGFYLPFSDIATTSGSNAGLGKDFSGNGNYWTTNNISVTSGVTYDAMLDSPTNTSATVANYCVMNPLGNAVGNAPATLSEANLTCKNTATSYLGALGTIGLPTSGKFYWEVQLTQNSGPSNLSVFGIAPSNIPLTGNQANYANSISWYLGNNTIIQLPSTGTVTAVSGGSTTSDVFQICYDGSTGKVYLGRNNTFYNSAGSATGNPSSGTNETTTLTTGDLLPWFFAYQEGATFNFGQRPFSYTPPTGFVALNTFNLPTSTIIKGNKYMDATLYTGNDTTQTITNAGGFKPDMVWVKSRSLGTTNNSYNFLVDSVRGLYGGAVYNYLNSNTTASENNNGSNLPTQYGGIASLNSNGFGVTGAGTDSYTNLGSTTYVGWQWQAGQGTNTTNTSGSITSTVSVNASAGFSVVTYTGNGTSNATVGHGLGVAPKMIVYKRRNDIGNWIVYHTSLGNNGSNYAFLEMNTTAGTQTVSSYLPVGGLSSTTFMTGTTGSVNASGGTYVAYCWAEIAGFSKFGSYTGNGSSDGPFVYTGFRPKFVLTKRISGVGDDWTLFDTARNTYNLATLLLRPNSNVAEQSSSIDILSNGFKWRQGGGNGNESSATYIYAAFAENPFKNALAR